MASRDSTIKSDVPGNAGSIKTWEYMEINDVNIGFSSSEMRSFNRNAWKLEIVFFVVKHPSVLGGNVNYFVHLLTRNYPFGKLV